MWRLLVVSYTRIKTGSIKLVSNLMIYIVVSNRCRMKITGTVKIIYFHIVVILMGEGALGEINQRCQI